MKARNKQNPSNPVSKKILFYFEIWGSYSGADGDSILPVCYVVPTGKQLPTFRRSVIPQPTGSATSPCSFLTPEGKLRSVETPVTSLGNMKEHPRKLECSSILILSSHLHQGHPSGSFLLTICMYVSMIKTILLLAFCIAVCFVQWISHAACIILIVGTKITKVT